MIPKFIEHFESESVKIRVNAIMCVSSFILIEASALMCRLEDFVYGLYRRTSDPSPEVRKVVCRALNSIIDVRPEVLIPQLNSVVEFMLFCTQDQDELVALEACEFWLVFGQQPKLRDHLDPYLTR